MQTEAAGLGDEVDGLLNPVNELWQNGSTGLDQDGSLQVGKQFEIDH